jgi:putative DNA primase/helicase
MSSDPNKPNADQDQKIIDQEEIAARVDKGIEEAKLKQTTDAELAQLALLSSVDYDRKRKSAAEKLGIRPATLDQLVKAKQSESKSAATPAASQRWQVEPWDQQVDGAALLNELRAAFQRYLVLPEHGAAVMALWTLHAWTIDAAFVSPFLTFTSPEMRCGKSTALGLLSPCAPRTAMASNITPSAIFRYVEAHQPTLLIDEGDTFLGGSEEMRGILNSGHTRDTAVVIRLVGDDHEAKEFSTWGPKVIAAIGKIAATLRDRSIIVSMQRKRRGERVAKLRARNDRSEFLPLRRKASRWAADNIETLKTAQPEIPELLNDRAADNWEPLLAIADLAGGNWPKLARTVAEKLSDAADADTPTIRLQLLDEIKKLFTTLKTDRLSSKGLLAALHSDDEGPWIAFGKNGKPITPKQVSDLLSDFEISPRSIREGQEVCRGYLLAQFTDAFTRYLPDTPSPSATPLQSNNSNDLDKKSSVTPSLFVADENPPNPLRNNNCNGVTDENPLPGDVKPKCDQCHGKPDGKEQEHLIAGKQVWLHSECGPHWLKDNGLGMHQ